MTVEGLERGAQVAVACPACSPEDDVVHELIKPDTHATVRCVTCDHVHKVAIETSPTISIRTVVSHGQESERVTAEVPRDETIAVGEEFVTEVDGAPIGVRITSLELEDGERVESTPAAAVRTIWTRAVDNVTVPATIHPPNGEQAGTESETYELPGDESLTVGENVPFTDETLRITGLVLRDDARGYSARKLDRNGRSANAKDVKRMYARRRGGDTWRSAWG